MNQLNANDDHRFFDESKNPNGWLQPRKQLVLLLKWHLGLIVSEVLGNTPKTIHLQGKQNVLILGTGPSLSRLDKKLANNYDCIVAINYALCHPVFISVSENRRVWFSCDPFRVTDLADELASSGNFPRLFYPVCPTNSLRVLSRPNLRRNITFIKPITYRTRYRDLILAGRPHTSVHPSLKIYIESCERAIAGLSGYVPCSHLTSALTAVVLFASMGARRIDLIGCDLNSSRDPHFSALGDADFDNNIGRRLVTELGLMMSKYGILLTNLSWL